MLCDCFCHGTDMRFSLTQSTYFINQWLHSSVLRLPMPPNGCVYPSLQSTTVTKRTGNMSSVAGLCNFGRVHWPTVGAYSIVREYVFYVFFSKSKKCDFLRFLKCHVKKRRKPYPSFTYTNQITGIRRLKIGYFPKCRLLAHYNIGLLTYVLTLK